MHFRYLAIASAAFSIAALATGGFARAADLPVKVTSKKAPDLPFFLFIDDRLTYSWQPNGTDPGVYSRNPDGTINAKTAKQYYSFTHFDVWQYGTNFFSLSYIKSDHNDPSNPCLTNATGGFTPSGCEGATEVYGLFRSTFGWNELFNTKQFAIGPLHNISFEVGMDANTENNFFASAKRDVVGGLQFAFDLPYKGYFNVAPLVYWEFANHDAFTQCGGFGGPIAYPAQGANCLIDGNRRFNPTWAVEMNYYMDLGFCPRTFQYFSISGRAGFYGKKGTDPIRCLEIRLSAFIPPQLNSTPSRSV